MLGNKNTKRELKLLHIGVHNSANKNAGDTLLFPVVRKIFDYFLGQCKWELHQAWDQFSLDFALKINQNFDGIVVGGGGLLLRDQDNSKTSKSGWQWNSSLDAINTIKIPLIVFAIGYNRFRGQPEFDPIFFKHINTTVDKSIFFGLRNNGSIKALKNYLNKDLSLKPLRQFCPTTVLWQLYPEYQALAKAHDKKKKRILSFNAAFDRSDLRFGSNPNEVIARVVNALKVAQTRGWKIFVTAHKEIDRKIVSYLNEQSILFDIRDLTNANEDEIMNFYSQIDFAFGMRGHSQMIPFGLRRPILSIISHDKMRFFLEDIKRLEWGIEVNSLELEKTFENFLKYLEEKRSDMHENISLAQQKIWQETESNFKELNKSLKLKINKLEN
jgi:polysaccharide pyruvyl transferase WcaK-like protein